MRAVAIAVLVVLFSGLAVLDVIGHAVAGGCECTVHGTRLLILDVVTVGVGIVTLVILARALLRTMRRRLTSRFARPS